MRIFDNIKGLLSKASEEMATTISAYVGGQSQFGAVAVPGLTLQKAMREGYKNSVWVHRCITEIGQAVGSVPWRVYSEKGTTLKALPGHDLEKLLERPNPYCTRKEHMDAWACYLSLAGKSYWEIVLAGGKPKHLYTVRPDWLKPIPDKVTFISGYEFKPPGQTGKPQVLQPEEILSFSYIDPEDPYGGLSPLQAAWRTIETESAAVTWNKALFDNSAIPGGVLKIPTQGLSKVQKEKLKEEVDRNFAGGNKFRTMVLWGNMEWAKMSLDAREMDFAKLRQLDKFEICAIHGVPPQVVGANEDPTYANYEIARTAFWEDKIIPMLEWMQSKINIYLAPYWGPNIVVRYDISDIPAMRSSFAAKVTTAKGLYAMGVPLNEVNRRLRLGFQDQPWGNIWWAPMNLMPIHDETTPEGSPTNPTPIAPGTGQDEGDDSAALDEDVND